MRNRRRLMLLGLIAGLGAACEYANRYSLTAPSAVGCHATVSEPHVLFAAGGGQATLQVQAAANCGWRATTSAFWLHVTPSVGEGDGAIVVVVVPNFEPAGRTALVALNTARLGVAQEGGGALRLPASAPPPAPGPAPSPAPSPGRQWPAPH